MSDGISTPRTIALVLALALSGCATAPSDTAARAASVIAATGQAKIVITRNTDMTYFGVAARVDINGARVAELSRGESYAGAYQPGEIVLTVDCSTTPEKFITRFKAEPDTEYDFEISPTPSQASVGMFFGLIGNAVDPMKLPNGPFAATLKETKPLPH